jgi:hypothetical protein
VGQSNAVLAQRFHITLVAAHITTEHKVCYSSSTCNHGFRTALNLELRVTYMHVPERLHPVLRFLDPDEGQMRQYVDSPLNRAYQISTTTPEATDMANLHVAL